MDLRLTGRVALVTGATRGIGLAIADRLAAEGCRLAICARSAGALEPVAAGLRERHGAEVAALVCDVGDAAALEAFVAAACERLGPPEVLVNNPSAAVDDDDDDAWRASFDVDLMGAVRATRLVADAMPASGGAIVHIASTSALEADGGPAAYAAMKAALIAHSRSLAEELAPRGIRVNAVAPGAVEFPGGYWDGVREDDPEQYASVLALSPLGRLGRPEEVADAVAFLASERAAYVTGALLKIDGGQSKASR